jgi:hypothetical protein
MTTQTTSAPFPPPLIMQDAAQTTALAGTPFDPVRVGKALDLVLTSAVTLFPDGTAQVRSGDTTYVVTDTCSCGCPDTQYRGTSCKHQLAAAIAREAATLLAQVEAPASAPAVLPQAANPALLRCGCIDCSIPE